MRIRPHLLAIYRTTGTVSSNCGADWLAPDGLYRLLGSGSSLRSQSAILILWAEALSSHFFAVGMSWGTPFPKANHVA